MNKKLTIILTASFKKGLFCNGLNQNIVTLAELLTKLGHRPILALNHEVNQGSDVPNDIDLVYDKDLGDLTDIDYLLQTAWVVNDSTLDQLKSLNPHIKNVHVHYGNRLLADVEQCRWDTSPVNNHRVDEVWVSPHYKFSFQYFQIYYNTQKVFTIPYIWSPKYIKAHDEIRSRTGSSCKYNPVAPKNLIVVEPNLNMTKNCLPSIMIMEEVFRRDPDSFNNATVYCSSVISKKRYFKKLMWELDIVKEGRLKFGPRQLISKTFSEGGNVMISHQLLNGLNYTYLEALYFNMPVIHNSEYIKECGYFYKDYLVMDGANQLVKALTHHDNNLEKHKSVAEKIIYRYSIDNPYVQSSYIKLFS